jgi:hypothetical protein
MPALSPAIRWCTDAWPPWRLARQVHGRPPPAVAAHIQLHACIPSPGLHWHARHAYAWAGRLTCVCAHACVLAAGRGAAGEPEHGAHWRGRRVQRHQHCAWRCRVRGARLPCHATPRTYSPAHEPGVHAPTAARGHARRDHLSTCTTHAGMRLHACGTDRSRQPTTPCVCVHACAGTWRAASW